MGLVNAGASAVVLDTQLDVGTLLDLVNQFHNFNPDSLVTDQVPTVAAPRGGVAYQDVDWEQTAPLLTPFQGVVLGQRPKPSDIIVDVRGKSPVDEVTTTFLDKKDFDAEAFGPKSVSSDTTTITFGPDGRDAALVLATYMKNSPKLVLDKTIVGYRVVLNVGSDFAGTREEPIAYEDLPPDLAPPVPTTTTTTTVPGTSSTTVPGTPTTEAGDTNRPAAPGVVPTDPERAAACR